MCVWVRLLAKLPGVLTQIADSGPSGRFWVCGVLPGTIATVVVAFLVWALYVDRVVPSRARRRTVDAATRLLDSRHPELSGRVWFPRGRDSTTGHWDDTLVCEIVHGPEGGPPGRVDAATAQDRAELVWRTMQELNEPHVVVRVKDEQRQEWVADWAQSAHGGTRPH